MILELYLEVVETEAVHEEWKGYGVAQLLAVGVVMFLS